MTRRCRIGFIVIASLMGLLLSRMVHAEWIALSTAHLLPGDPSLILTPPSGSAPPLTVQSRTPSDLKWLVVSLPVAPGQAIDVVELCYQAPDDGTFLRQVRLVEYLDAARGLVVHDDGTVLRSPTATCYRSRVPDYMAADAVSLWLRLEFAQADDVIVIHSVNVHVP
jgi:hypothetical protein